LNIYKSIAQVKLSIMKDNKTRRDSKVTKARAKKIVDKVDAVNDIRNKT